MSKSTTQTSQPATPRDLLNASIRIANDPWHTIWLCPLLLLADTVLTAGIIWKIPYTEIDWRAYMQQISTYLSGERNYLKIRGDTGPLVYPALHVHIYRVLHHLTSSGHDIALAQTVFAALYLATLALVMACYRHAGVAPWVYPLLVLSKRLHSVYVLRLFNDCFAVVFLWGCIYCFQTGRPRVAALVFSLGVAVKMSLLLALPAVAWLLYMAQGGPGPALASLAVMLQYQVLLAWPFIAKFPREYVARAFEFGRRFEWKWTVNWRWVGRERFEDERFATGLLVGHAVVMGLFVVFRWFKHAGTGLGEVVGSVFSPLGNVRSRTLQGKVTPEFALTSILTANVIGMLFARSLHYQFYSWLAWGTPYLLWRSGQTPFAVIGAWIGQEVVWNIYPSTVNSSLMVGVWMLVQVHGIWAAPPVEELWETREATVKAARKVSATERASGKAQVVPPAVKDDVDAISSAAEPVPAAGKSRTRKR